METNQLLGNPFIFALTRFDHRPRTDIRRKQINNKDFIVLCMFVAGPLMARELRCLSKAWRGDERKLNAYFIPHYGHTATDKFGTRRYKGTFGPRLVARLWYRAREHAARGYHRSPSGRAVAMVPFQNGLTLQGERRAVDLLRCPTVPSASPAARRARTDVKAGGLMV